MASNYRLLAPVSHFFQLKLIQGFCVSRERHKIMFFFFFFFLFLSHDLHNMIVLYLPHFFVHPSIHSCHTSVISECHSVCVSLCILHALVCFSAHICSRRIIVLCLSVTLTHNLSSARSYLLRLLPNDK